MSTRRERNVRDRALRLNLGVHKSRGDGRWFVTDVWTASIVFPPQGDGVSLEEVEGYLAEAGREEDGMRSYLVMREDSTYIAGEVFEGSYVRDTLEQGFPAEDIVTEQEARQDPALRAAVEAWNRGDDSTAAEENARYDAQDTVERLGEALEKGHPTATVADELEETAGRLRAVAT
jgi:hypothetical protein